MRILVVCLFVAIAGGATAPNSMELRNRYGAPNQETFTARPGIDVTVQYGPDRQACDVEIGPSRHLLDSYPPTSPPKMVPAKDVSEILEEIAPTAARGKEIDEGSFQSGCYSATTITEYENVVIRRGLSGCDSPNNDQQRGASVSFKREVCPSRPSGFSIRK